MSAKKHFDKTRPQEFMHARNTPGAISFKMDCNEVDETRTIHLDVHDKFPFGHITVYDAMRLRDWLDGAIVWLRK